MCKSGRKLTDSHIPMDAAYDHFLAGIAGFGNQFVFRKSVSLAAGFAPEEDGF